jgi:pimeloyl-ACP methyl ester carboxylesterase
MKTRNRILTFAGAAAGLAAGLAAERVALTRRRARDPEADEPFGTRRGERSRKIELDDGAKIFVEEVGPTTDRAAVFIHGSALRTDMWHYQMAGLDGHRLIFYDMRGHGLSQPKGDSEYSIKTLATDLATVIENSNLKECVIVGHSVGGVIAMKLCLERPELLGSTIKGLGLLNTTHGPFTETILGAAVLARIERATRRPLDVLGSQSHRLDVLRRVIRPSDAVFWGVALAAFGPQASASQIDFVYDMLAETPSDVLFDLVRSYRDSDVTEQLSEIAVPCRLIGGTHDRLTLARASASLAEGLPKAELSVLENCGHMSMLERHEHVNEMLVTFLSDTLGKPKGNRKKT